MLENKNIIIGISGSIAAYKTAILIRLLKKEKANVKVVVTENALNFITPLTLSTLSENKVYSTSHNKITGEWNSHVELGNWADLMIIAPASANTISSMANGRADNILLTTYLAARCPVFIAPAMDVDMYKHLATQNNIKALVKNNVKIISSRSGELASGLCGEGRMEEPEEIFRVIKNYFSSSLPFKGKEVLVTAGPTYEKIDPVRFIGNNSSGKMGYAIAEEFAKQGANVKLISGPVNLSVKNNNIEVINIFSAQEMYDATIACFKTSSICVMSAAVADYTPEKANQTKLKKQDSDLTIKLKSTKDILKELGKLKTKKQILVGFALETNNEESNAKQKLTNKNLDFVVLNSLKDKGAGFEHDTNKITIIDKNNKIEHFELKEKTKVAVDIINKVSQLLFRDL